MKKIVRERHKTGTLEKVLGIGTTKARTAHDHCSCCFLVGPVLPSWLRTWLGAATRSAGMGDPKAWSSPSSSSRNARSFERPCGAGSLERTTPKTSGSRRRSGLLSEDPYRCLGRPVAMSWNVKTWCRKGACGACFLKQI